MYKLDELDELNLLDPIQARLNERGDVSQEQQSQFKNSPSLVITYVKDLWSNITFLGIFLAGFILLLGFEAELSMPGNLCCYYAGGWYHHCHHPGTPNL